MTKEIRSPNVQLLRVVRSPVSSFGFRLSFGFRHSSFGFENRGSWRAPFRLFSACIGTMNRFVLVLEAKEPIRGRGRERRRGRKGGSGKVSTASWLRIE